LIIAELEKIEVAVRSKMAYVMSMAHSSFWIENTNLFSNATMHQTTITKIEEELSRTDDDVIISFKSIYSNPFPPSFMLLEIASFGILLRLYNNLSAGKTKQDIAAKFGLSDTVFASWLHCIVSVRNICAHHERLWNRQLRIQPLFPRHTRLTWLNNRTAGNNRIFYAVSIIIYLLNVVNPNHTFKRKLNDLFAKYPTVDIRAMGFPADWQSEPLWK
jgi:abortive infection bacteriophage resistance protein